MAGQPLALTAPSDPLRIGSIGEGELEGDSPPEEVAAKIHLGRPDPVQFRSQKLDEVAEARYA